MIPIIICFIKCPTELCYNVPMRLPSSRIESDEPEELDPKDVLGYINELEQVLGEKSFIQQKTFLRRFIKRMEFKPEGVVLDYTIPVPVGKNRTSTREVLYIKQDGSGDWIRTGTLSNTIFQTFCHLPAHISGLPY